MMGVPDFIPGLIDRRSEVTIFLLNGIKLTGIIEAESEEGILLTGMGHTQLVKDHAISTIMINGKAQTANMRNEATLPPGNCVKKA